MKLGIIISLLALLYSSLSSAQDYYWTSSADGGLHHSSASAACSSGISAMGGPGVKFIRFESDIFAWCEGNNYSGQSYGPAFWMSRYGNSCPGNQTYNSAIGGCSCPDGQSLDSATGLCAIPNACSSRKDQTSTFRRSGTAPDDFFSISSGRPTPKSRSGCFDGCAAEMEDLRCTHKTSGTYTCRISASFTGESCGSGGSGPEESTADAPEPITDTKSTPCYMQTNADGTQSCASSSTVDKEGKNCGTFNGDQYCVDKNANKNDVQIKTNVKTETLADGGTKTIKTDTATITLCTGVNSCTTSVTTTTTTTTKDASGNTTGGSSSCTGKACPDKSTNPDADGDGLGDCLSGCSTGEGSEEEGGTASTSSDCNVPPPCDGDVFLCAILKQSAINHCLDRALPTAAEKQEFHQKVDAEYSKIDDLQAELDQKVTSAFSDFEANATGNENHGSGKCLPDYKIQFMSTTITMEFSKLCDILVAFRFALLAAAYMAAARIISKQI